MGAEAFEDGRAGRAICLDCEWESPLCRSITQAEVAADFHNRHKHGGAA